MSATTFTVEHDESNRVTTIDRKILSVFMFCLVYHLKLLTKENDIGSVRISNYQKIATFCGGTI